MIGYGNSMLLATHGILAKSASGSAFDSDAQAFITAAAITDPTQQSAINTLVTDLKGYGIWTKLRACYPFIGGTSSTHKWNLKDPRDLDVAFRLVFSGGWTHSSTGATPNGTNAYADTKLTPSSTLTQLNTHLSFYSRTNSTAADRAAIGSTNAPSYTTSHQLILKWSDGKSYGLIDSNNSVSFTNTNSSGLYVLSRTANNSLKTYKNNSIAATLTTTITPVANNSVIYIGARNETGSLAQLFDNKECAFASIGDGLTDTEAANFYTAVQAFQTTLGRQV